MNNVEHYEHFSAIDLVEDSYFRQWVREGEKTDQAFWTAFLEVFPHKRKDLEEAVSMYRAILNRFDLEISDDAIKSSFERTRKRALAKPAPGRKRISWWQIAAGFLLLAGASLLLLNKKNPPALIYSTGYGEKREILLPDSSTVVLNAKASVTLLGDWQPGSTRALILEGEAYFKVKKDLQGHGRFVVHADGLDVKVYGTQFNVYSRGDLTEVALDEGRILLEYEDTLSQLDSLFLHPGEVVSYQIEKKEILFQQDHSGNHSSWRNGTLFFTKKPLAYILNKMSEIYGLQFQIADKDVSEKLLTGGIPIENLELALESVSTLYDLEVEQKDNYYLIKSR